MKKLVTAAVLGSIVALWGCDAADSTPAVDLDASGDVTTDTMTDMGWDTAYDVPDVPVDAGSDDGGGELVLPDCSSCWGVGEELENLRCAIDLCDDAVFVSQTYTSPTITRDEKLRRSRAAVERFGSDTNDLRPLYPETAGSYVLMSTGYAVPSVPPDAYDHNQSLSGTLLNPDGPSVPDPHAAAHEYPSYDVVEWSLILRAPDDAHGFQVHYVFFSVEYDEYVGREFNDKFYMLLDASTTEGMEHPIINYTECRPTVTTPDFVCPAGNPGCEAGDELCYIAINSGLSECCWYDGCTTMASNTDITGTGYECGTEDVDYVGDYSMGFTYGSSTGWLVTEWPIEPGETFTITFHLHDTADSILDSTVLLDKFVFVREADAGTTVLI